MDNTLRKTGREGPHRSDYTKHSANLMKLVSRNKCSTPLKFNSCINVTTLKVDRIWQYQATFLQNSALNPDWRLSWISNQR